MRRLFADTTSLQTPDFRRLWVAGIVTVIGANLTIFAVPVQLYALSQNSAYVGAHRHAEHDQRPGYDDGR